jgi:anti-sigma B factor antagonist
LSQSLRPRGPVELRLSHYERPYATVVAAAGELDLLTAPAFSAKINELVCRQPSDIVVDLSEVQFMDSAGLQILLSAERRVTRRARRLTVICPAGPVRRVIELARLTDVLGLVSSFGEYEARLGRPEAAG